MSNILDNSQKNKIQELVDSEGSVIDGDRNATNDSEIESGPVDKPFNDTSDYSKGIATTTDRATRYRQNIPWFAVYSYRGTAGTTRPINEKTNNIVLTKTQLEEEIKEDLVKKNNQNRDIFDKTYNGSVEKIIDTINDVDLTTSQLEKIKKTILNKLMKTNA